MGPSQSKEQRENEGLGAYTGGCTHSCCVPSLNQVTLSGPPKPGYPQEPRVAFTYPTLPWFVSVTKGDSLAWRPGLLFPCKMWLALHYTCTV